MDVHVKAKQFTCFAMDAEKRTEKATGEQNEVSLSSSASTQKVDSLGVYTGQDQAPKLPPPTTSGATCTDMPPADDNEPAAEAVATAFRKGDGWAPIKPEFIRSREEIIALEKACGRGCNGRDKNGEGAVSASSNGGVDSSAEDRKKGKRGRNKKRPKDDRPAHAETLCMHLSVGRECHFGSSCRFSHDIKAYLQKKGPDIGDTCPIWNVRGSCPSGLKCRFGNAHTDPETLKPITRPSAADPSTFEHINDLSRDLQTKLRRNEVPFACDRKGWAAFLASLDSDYPESRSQATPSTENGTVKVSTIGAALKDPVVAVIEKQEGTDGSLADVSSPDAAVNNVTAAVVFADNRETSVEMSKVDHLMPLAKRSRCEGVGDGGRVGIPTDSRPREEESGSGSLTEPKQEPQRAAGEKGMEEGGVKASTAVRGGCTNGNTVNDGTGSSSSGLGDADVGAMGNAGERIVEKEREGEWVRSAIEGTERRERRSVDFEGKVYVAPLTTVGNLPFRRVMKDLGADITCGEMALSNQILKGNGSEWALLRRHPCEDVFGVQVAGAHPDQMTRVAELLENHTKVDFVDINMGCPIDLVCEKGMGAALMGRTRKLRGIIAGMTSQLSCPLTVKMRVGWDEKKPNADTVVRVVQREAERCRKRGFPGSVAHVMIHGRSRLQRYSKLADWSYVRQVAASQDTTVPPLPVIGNGDILSWRDHEDRLEQAMRELDEVEAEGHRRWSTCCMLARGALIKPWLPTEVKEKRDWDISSSERLDIYRKFVHYGLEHWGSDQMGVNKTRRFLLEWLSFTCRYIPVKILEVLPQRINERPVPYNGRDELESLMCSQNPGDWIKICEMLLGPVPQDFEFVPKHKANSYAPQAAVSLA